MKAQRILSLPLLLVESFHFLEHENLSFHRRIRHSICNATEILSTRKVPMPHRGQSHEEIGLITYLKRSST